jgi:hypothetical protein
MTETDRFIGGLTANLPDILVPWRETLTDLRAMAGLYAEGSTVLSDAIDAAPDDLLLAGRDFTVGIRRFVEDMCCLAADVITTQFEWLPLSDTEREQLAQSLRGVGPSIPPLDAVTRMLTLTFALAWRRGDLWYFAEAPTVVAQVTKAVRMARATLTP